MAFLCWHQLERALSTDSIDMTTTVSEALQRELEYPLQNATEKSLLVVWVFLPAPSFFVLRPVDVGVCACRKSAFVVDCDRRNVSQ